MSKTATVFLTLLLILASCLIAGCSSLPIASETPAPTVAPVKTGSTGEGNPDAAGLETAALSQRYAFEEILENLELLDLETKQPVSSFAGETPGDSVPGENISASVPDSAAPAGTVKKQIKQVRGGNLDENGDATSWTFIVEHSGKVSVVSFSHQGTTYTGSPGTLNLPEINTDQIILPGKLFEKNHDLIFNTGKTGTDVTRDISLVADNYTVTISNKRGPSEILTFNAKTGALIS